MGNRILIFGTSYVASAAAAFTYRLWAHVLRERNPGAYILAVDTRAEFGSTRIDGVDVLQLPDNIGHLSKNGRDGWGRAWTRGIDFGLSDDEFEWIAHVEADLLCAVPIADIVAKMERANVKIAMPVASPYGFPETALMIARTDYLRESRLVERYDWATSDPAKLPEKRIAELTAPDLFLLPMQGARIDRPITLAGLYEAFPDGMDWITHAQPALLRAFLRMNGISEP